MNESELDDVYTEVCRSMSAVGEDEAKLFLARLVLLLLREVDDASRIKYAIAQAAATAPAQAAQ